MSIWKIKRSRKAGVKPNVNQFPDSETVIWNQADGKLWGLGVDNSGNRFVVLIGGGINTIGETHARLHQMDSEDDHPPAAEEHWGKYVRADPTTGKIIFDNTPIPGVAIVLLAGQAGYIEAADHNLGGDIQVEFYHVYTDSGETYKKPVFIHFELIGSAGRIYWASTFMMDSHIAVIK